MLCYTSLLNLLSIPPPFSSLLCSFVLSKNKAHRKQWREAAGSEQMGIHGCRINLCSWVWNWQSFLGKQITESPENSQVMKAQRMRRALNVNACCVSEVSVSRLVEQLVVPYICCILPGLRINTETKFFATDAYVFGALWWESWAECSWLLINQKWPS